MDVSTLSPTTRNAMHGMVERYHIVLCEVRVCSMWFPGSRNRKTTCTPFGIRDLDEVRPLTNSSVVE